MHIFAFKVPLLYNSTILAFFLSIVFFRKSYVDSMIRIFTCKITYIILLMFLFPVLYACILTVYKGAYDLSYIGIWLGNIIYFFMTASLASVIYGSLNVKPHPFLLLIVITVIQCLVIVFAFSSASFLDFIKLFQDATQSEVAGEYYGGGVRGLALSGGQFFNLSALFTFLLIIFSVYNVDRTKSVIWDLVLLFCFLCSLTTGRTVFVVLPFIFIINFFSRRKYITKSIFVTFILLVVFMLIFSLGFEGYFYLPDSIKETFYSFSRFAFEFVYNYINNGSVGTASTNRLGEMFFIPSASTLFFGDGMYTGIDGRYYMHTDSGYMRNILLFGIVGFLPLLLYNFCVIRFISINLLKKTGSVFLFCTFLTLLVLHLKGEVVGYLITVNIMFLFLFFSSFIYKDENSIKVAGTMENTGHPKTFS